MFTCRRLHPRSAASTVAITASPCSHRSRTRFQEAVARARARYGTHRIGIFLGTSTSGILQTELAYRDRDPDGALPTSFDYAGTHNNFSLTAFLREQLDLHGPAVTVSTACSSSAKVFGNAARMIAAGLCDAAIVGGTDSLCLTTLYGFGSLELLSREPCRPFDAQRSGISIGEGAGFALARTRTSPVPDDAIVLLGVGESSDAYPHVHAAPRGRGCTRGDGRRARKRRHHAARRRLHQPARHRHPQQRRSGRKGRIRAVRRRHPCSSDQGCNRPSAGRERHRRGPDLRTRAARRIHAGQSQHAAARPLDASALSARKFAPRLRAK